MTVLVNIISQELSCRPDIGDINLLAEFLKDLVFNSVVVILQLRNVSILRYDLTLQLSDFQLCNKQLYHEDQSTALKHIQKQECHACMVFIELLLRHDMAKK